MKLAIIGDRGIPACYSGFSTLVEQLAVRLVREFGFEVTVYCRSAYYELQPEYFKGVRCVYLPAPGGKSFESIVHSNLAILHALFQPFDMVFLLDPGNAPFALPLKLRQLPVLIHTDGMGWKRAKWNYIQRRYYKWSERVSVALATWLVTDSRAMQDYYRKEYDALSTFIPYAGEVVEHPDDALLLEHGLVPAGYYICCARVEPENNIHIIIREFKKVTTKRRLVVVGAVRYDSAYARAVVSETGENILFLGGVYDSHKLDGLFANCYAYIHGHEVGGTNPSLLNAMHRDAAPVCMDVVYHREVMSNAGEYFNKDEGNLANILDRLETDPDRVAGLKILARQRSDHLYRWDAVCSAYAHLFQQILDGYRVDEEIYRPADFSDD
jgi:glycosyltransferase involved in cell wall biosynthesis